MRTLLRAGTAVGLSTLVAFGARSPGEARGDAPPSLAQEAENIVTAAGTGPYIGDGEPATSAGLNLIEGVAVSPAGDLWLADTGNNRIRRVDPVTGVITTGVGTGVVGFSGDGGPATQARINSPSDLAFDPSGNLYFTDAGNHCVRRIDQATGIITTVGGTGIAGYVDGPASTAQFNQPRGIAILADASGVRLYIADLRNHVIRRIDQTGMVTTAAGTGAGVNSTDGGLATETPINNPFGVAVDAAGSLYIGEGGIGATFSHRIRRVDAATQIITTVAGTGVAGFSPDGTLATAAMINSPRDIELDASGNLYFVDNANNRIRVVDAASGTVATVAGMGIAGFGGDDGPAIAARIAGPFFIALDGARHLYIGDRGNSRARRVDRVTGIITTAAGGFIPEPGDGSAAIAANLGNPAGISFDVLGNLYIVENLANRVRRVDAATGLISTVAGNGQQGLSPDGIPAVQATLNGPHGIAIDSSINLYVADSVLPRVRKIDASGIITTVAGTGVAGLSGDGGLATLARLSPFRVVALDRDGNLWIADAANHRIRFVNLSSTTVTVAGQPVAPGIIVTVVGTVQGFAGDGGPAAAARITQPLGLAFNSAGLFVSELNRVRFVNLTNSPITIHNQAVAAFHITTIAGIGSPGPEGDGGPATAAQLFAPQGLATDATGNLYIADTNNHRIRRVDVNGVITTVAGNGLPAFSGDGDLAAANAIQNPRFVTFDASWNLYASEFGGNRVRRLNVAAKELSVFRTGGTILAQVELHEQRRADDLTGVTLTVIDSSGRPISAAVPGARLDAGPTAPRNQKRRYFLFSPDGALLGGVRLRLDGRLASDGRRFSGDCSFQNPVTCLGPDSFEKK